MNITQVIILLILIILANFAWNKVLYKKDNIVDVNQVLNSPSDELNNSSNRVASTTVILSILSIIPLLSGLYFVNSWFNDYNLANDSVNWEPCPGRILSKNVVNFRSSGITSHQSSGLLYIPEIEYAFKYKDQTYKANLIDLLNEPAHGDKSKSQTVVDSFPEAGESVTVYYSPKYDKSVLITGFEKTNYLGLLGGWMFFIIGLICIKLLFRYLSS